MVLVYREALAYSDPLLSEETKYIHINRKKEKGVVAQRIPLHENLLYCLVSFKAHEKERIEYAKERLFSLLHFQNKEGAFPEALHSFPEPAPLSLQTSLALPLLAIYKDYSKFIGRKQKATLETALVKLAKYIKNHISQEAFLTNFKFSQILLSLGDILSDQKMQKEGSEIELFCFQEKEAPYLNYPDVLGQMMQALTLNYESFAEIRDSFFKAYVPSIWNKDLGVYVGPHIKPLQYENKAMPHLFDLVIALETGELLEHHLAHKELFLYGALLKKMEIPSLNQSHASVTQSSRDHFYFPWCGYYREKNSLYSLALYTEGHPVEIKQEGGATTLIITCDHEKILNQQAPLQLFLSDIKPLTWKIKTGKATTFHPEETLYLEGDSLSFKITFFTEKKGHHICHIHRGNRPGQMRHTEAFDWKIFLRTLKWTDGEKLFVQIKQN